MEFIELPVEGGEEETRLSRLKNLYYDKFGEFPPRWTFKGTDNEFADAVFVAINTGEPLNEEYEKDNLY